MLIKQILYLPLLINTNKLIAQYIYNYTIIDIVTLLFRLLFRTSYYLLHIKFNILHY